MISSSSLWTTNFNLKFKWIWFWIHFLFLVPLEFPIIKREHFNGWYSSNAYYSSLMIFDAPIIFVCVTTAISIEYLMTGQPLEINRYLVLLGFCLLTSYVAQALAIVLTSLLNVQVRALRLILKSFNYDQLLIFTVFFTFWHLLLDAFLCFFNIFCIFTRHASYTTKFIWIKLLQYGSQRSRELSFRT